MINEQNLKINIENNFFDIKSFKKIIQKKQQVVIITHTNPDGDSIGSSSGLAMLFNKLETKATAITPNRAAAYLRGIAGFEHQIDFTENPQSSKELILGADLIICADFNDCTTRIGELGSILMANKSATKMIIDHHVLEGVDTTQFNLIFSDSKESSTSHLVLKLIIEAGYSDIIDEKIASALYAGIISDTGNFAYGNITPELFKNVAFLVEKGAVPRQITNSLFNVKNESSLRILGYGLSDKMVIDYDKKAGIISLSEEELTKFSYQSGDTDGLVNRPLTINGIENSALFTQADGFVKISLRSLPDGRDVNQFARQHYSGGGHVNAAGAKAFCSMEEAIEIFWKNI